MLENRDALPLGTLLRMVELFSLENLCTHIDSAVPTVKPPRLNSALTDDLRALYAALRLRSCQPLIITRGQPFRPAPDLVMPLLSAADPWYTYD